MPNLNILTPFVSHNGDDVLREPDVKGKLNLSPSLFNAIAMIFVIGILPITLGIASSLATVEEYNYNDALVYGFNQNDVSPYLETPDYAQYFRDRQSNANTGEFSCGHIENSAYFVDEFLPSWFIGTQEYWDNYHTYIRGYCLGDGDTVSNPATYLGIDYGERDIIGSVEGINTILQPQIWNVGEKFDGSSSNVDASIDSVYSHSYPYSIAETQNAQLSIIFKNSSTGTDFNDMVYLSSFKFTMTDSANSYLCNNTRFSNDLNINYKLQFLNFGNLTTIEFEEVGLSNSKYVGITNGERMCVPSLTLTPKFEYFEIITLIEEFTGSGWGNVSVILEIDSVTDNNGLVNSYFVPWAGTGYMRTSFEYSNYDDVAINEQLKVYLGAIGAVLIYFGLASTSYYNPIFRGLAGMREGQ